MAERDTLRKVKDRQGILAKIQNFFTLGYGTKEDLRELDKKLRDVVYEDLRAMRHVWEDAYLAALEAGYKVVGKDFKKVIQVLDRVMEKVRHADYGYAGLMDRKGHIREEELARVFDFDRTLSEEVEKLKGTINKVSASAESESWGDLPAEVKAIKGLILALENKWQEREKQFRPLEI
jgi:hypothetical protein